MLLGRHDGKIDAKHRVSFPSVFRKTLGDSFIVTTGFEKSLIIVALDNWKTLLEGTIDKPLTDEDSRQTQRFLLGNATSVQLDKKGRFLLPAYLKTHAQLFDEIVFLGMARFIEAWDKKRWEEYNSELAKHIAPIANRLTEGKT
ncbi:MAG TPA: division/cell wall cluster transcriptional repressor MraZ [Candidatus Saccharimonadales bacterium]|nr:division/cell wall cluster transcriptional repressor MraZ [Candidatus Saccharimonadales bacterium]